MIRLSNAHIILEKEVAEQLFESAAQVNWVYYPQRKTLLIAASTDELFKSMHKTSMSMLKLRNDKGDRSISILELMIDNDINQANRLLNYKADSVMKILTVFFENQA